MMYSNPDPSFALQRLLLRLQLLHGIENSIHHFSLNKLGFIKTLRKIVLFSEIKVLIY